MFRVVVRARIAIFSFLRNVTAASAFFIEAEFTTQAEHNSQNMPKCLVFL